MIRFLSYEPAEEETPNNKPAIFGWGSGHRESDRRYKNASSINWYTRDGIVRGTSGAILEARGIELFQGVVIVVVTLLFQHRRGRHSGVMAAHDCPIPISSNSSSSDSSEDGGNSSEGSGSVRTA